MKKFSVEPFPAFALLDSEGNELGRGGPPYNVEGAKTWFPKIADAYRNLATYEAIFKQEPMDLINAVNLAKVYSITGKKQKALKMLRGLSEKSNEGHDGFVELQILTCDLLKTTATRSNHKEVCKEIISIHETIVPKLLKDKDDRAVDLVIFSLRVKVGHEKNTDGAIEQMGKLEELFGMGPRGTEIKFWKAVFTAEGGDVVGGKKQLQAIIKNGDAEDKWVKNAKNQLEGMTKNGK